MNCDQALEPLHDRLDGTLSPTVLRSLQEHLAGCASCRALADDLEVLRAAARALPPERPPTKDLWPQIALRIRPLPARRWVEPRWLAAAVALVAVGTSVVVALNWRTGAPPDETPAKVAADDLSDAAAELRAAVEAQRDTLDPETRRVIDENLRLIDDAIHETQLALEAHPGDRGLEKQLDRATGQRVALLRQALNLTTGG